MGNNKPDFRQKSLQIATKFLPLIRIVSMAPKVVIENPILRGSRDGCVQIVARVYLDGGEEFRIIAPERATGDALDWLLQLEVRTNSKDPTGLGGCGHAGAWSHVPLSRCPVKWHENNRPGAGGRELISGTEELGKNSHGCKGWGAYSTRMNISETRRMPRAAASTVCGPAFGSRVGTGCMKIIMSGERWGFRSYGVINDK